MVVFFQNAVHHFPARPRDFRDETVRKDNPPLCRNGSPVILKNPFRIKQKPVHVENAAAYHNFHPLPLVSSIPHSMLFTIKTVTVTRHGSYK